MIGEPGIARSIKGFVFDDPSHFTPPCSTRCGSSASRRTFTSAATRTGSSYPGRPRSWRRRAGQSDRAHETGRGHLRHRRPRAPALARPRPSDRVRNMRYWDGLRQRRGRAWRAARATTPTPRTRPRHASSATRATTFRSASTSSCTPPTGVRSARRATRTRCCAAPLGRIDVFPDHPHEGECRVPADLGLGVPRRQPASTPDDSDGSAGQVRGSRLGPGAGRQRPPAAPSWPPLRTSSALSRPTTDTWPVSVGW